MSVNVFFLRVSSSSQHLESQRDELFNHFVKEDNLDENTIRVIQNKESAVKLSEEERLGIVELKELILTEGVDTVYVSEISRIARTENVLWSLIYFLKDHRVQLKCKNPKLVLLKEDRSDLTFEARLIVGTFGALATQEAIEKRARFARGKKRLADLGRYNGGAIPFGYYVNEENHKKIEEDIHEANIVREIFNLYEQGFSQMAITKILYYRGVKGRAVRKTKNITISLVHQILTNRLLTGEPHKGRGSSYERQYPQIISKEQFERCRLIAQKNNKNASKSPVPYYGAKIIKCKSCGRNYVSTGQSGYYHCQDAYNLDKTYNGYPGEPRCTNRVTISYNVADALLWDIAKKHECRYIFERAKSDIHHYEVEIEKIKEELSELPKLELEIKDKLERMAKVYADGDISEEGYSNYRRKVKIGEQEIKKRRVAVLEKLNHYTFLREEALKSPIMKNIGPDYIIRMDAIDEDLSKVVNDEDRRAIIRKHIKVVYVEMCDIPELCTTTSKGTKRHVKKITILMHSGAVEIFWYVPFDGKGGHILKKVNNRYLRHEIEFFKNRYAKHKYKKREETRRLKQSTKQADFDEMASKNYVSMEDMSTMSGLSISTLYKAISSKLIKGAVNIHHKWFAPTYAFAEYLQSHKPRKRKTSTIAKD